MECVDAAPLRLAVPPALDAAAFAGHDPAAGVTALDGLTMGTSWRVLYADRGLRPAAELRAAIVARLDALVAQLSHWAPESDLCRFNRAPAGSWHRLPPDLARVMEAGIAIAAATGGAFDPAIGALVDLWGHGPPGAMPPPDAAAIATARDRSGYRRLRIEAGGARWRQPGGVALDLSGIAKGHAADALADLLQAQGIRHCLVEVGGELAGRGLRPDGDPWWVELEAPEGTGVAPLRVALHQMGVATSGNYRRGDHTLDPRTGRPPVNGVVAASVVAATAMAADALASAATVLFPDLAPLIATGVAARVIAVADGRATETITPALAAMMDAD